MAQAWKMCARWLCSTRIGPMNMSASRLRSWKGVDDVKDVLMEFRCCGVAARTSGYRGSVLTCLRVADALCERRRDCESCVRTTCREELTCMPWRIPERRECPSCADQLSRRDRKFCWSDARGLRGRFECGARQEIGIVGGESVIQRHWHRILGRERGVGRRTDDKGRACTAKTYETTARLSVHEQAEEHTGCPAHPRTLGSRVQSCVHDIRVLIASRSYANKMLPGW